MCDQVSVIRKTDCLSELELEAIKRQVGDYSQSELCREADVKVVPETVGADVGTADKDMYNVEDNIINAGGELNE